VNILKALKDCEALLAAAVRGDTVLAGPVLTDVRAALESATHITAGQSSMKVGEGFSHDGVWFGPRGEIEAPKDTATLFALQMIKANIRCARKSKRPSSPLLAWLS
jgi:hypothetical protein